MNRSLLEQMNPAVFPEIGKEEPGINTAVTINKHRSGQKDGGNRYRHMEEKKK